MSLNCNGHKDPKACEEGGSWRDQALISANAVGFKVCRIAIFRGVSQTKTCVDNATVDINHLRREAISLRILDIQCLNRISLKLLVGANEGSLGTFDIAIDRRDPSVSLTVHASDAAVTFLLGATSC